MLPELLKADDSFSNFWAIFSNVAKENKQEEEKTTSEMVVSPSKEYGNFWEKVKIVLEFLSSSNCSTKRDVHPPSLPPPPLPMAVLMALKDGGRNISVKKGETCQQKISQLVTLRYAKSCPRRCIKPAIFKGIGVNRLGAVGRAGT